MTLITHLPFQDTGNTTGIVNLGTVNFAPAPSGYISGNVASGMFTGNGPGGSYPNCFYFSTGIVILNPSGVLNSSTGFTIAYWIKMPDKPSAVDERNGLIWLSKPSNPNNPRAAIEINRSPSNGSLIRSFMAYQSTAIATTTTSTADAAEPDWYHEVLSVDYNTKVATIYRNGVLLSSDPNPFTITGYDNLNVSEYTIGRTHVLNSSIFHYGNFWLADFRLYNEYLTSVEVQEIVGEVTGVPIDISGEDGSTSITNGYLTLSCLTDILSQTVSSEDGYMTGDSPIYGLSNNFSSTDVYTSREILIDSTSNTASDTTGLGILLSSPYVTSNTVSYSQTLLNASFAMFGQDGTTTNELGTVFITTAPTGTGAGGVPITTTTSLFDIYNNFALGHTHNYNDGIEGYQRLHNLAYFNGVGGVYKNNEISGIYKLYKDRFHKTFRVSDVTSSTGSLLLQFAFHFTGNVDMYTARMNLYNSQSGWYTDTNVILSQNTLQYQFYPTVLGANMIQPFIGDWVGPIYKFQVM